MPILTPSLATQLWYDALAQEHGLVIPVDPAKMEAIRPELYKARRTAADPLLDCLSITVRADGSELWIWRKPEARLDD